MVGRTGRVLALLMAGSLVLGGCSQAASSPAASVPAASVPAASVPAASVPAASEAAASEAAATGCVAGAAAGTQIPEAVEGKFNVAMVLIGPHDDGGWSQAHYEGLMYVCENVAESHVAYIENVPEGADSEQTFRSLARKGFNFIIGTSFGYMDPMETVAAEFPDQTFLHLTGYKSNGKNFGNFFGAMETMKYLAGMVAGSRAKADGNPRVGYMATFPIPEELRLGNAIMRGVKVTCPECTMDVVFINTWHDPIKEKAGATALFDAGAQVVFTGADTGAVADVAQEKGKWGITYDHPASCKVDACLTAPYWIWGPEYTRIAEQVKAKTYKAGYEYFDADAGAMALLGFMEGETLRKGVASLPEADLKLVKDTLATMLKSGTGRFDIVFPGPIVDNAGKTLLAAGGKLQQSDLDQFPPGAPGSECTTCMYWWNEGITAELPALDN
ncbi:MAG TPA: BMP family ABC transporter substrate-binding protein [Candidatus Limnocylindrales bacterium]|nr:BMP family ABC transporter substrate-binding protein [Candidatus Limnocylindrales bacterium]